MQARAGQPHRLHAWAWLQGLETHSSSMVLPAIALISYEEMARRLEIRHPKSPEYNLDEVIIHQNSLLAIPDLKSIGVLGSTSRQHEF